MTAHSEFDPNDKTPNDQLFGVMSLLLYGVTSSDDPMLQGRITRLRDRINSFSCDEARHHIAVISVSDAVQQIATYLLK